MCQLIVDRVHKTYAGVAGGIHALRGVSFTADRGDFIALWGPSGCGKSTLLHLVGGMDQPSEGTVQLNGRRVHELSRAELACTRRREIGFVFQAFHLLPTLTVSENVSLPLTLDGRPHAEADRRAAEVLERVGLGHRQHQRPAQLSGGEMQRVAVARAVVARPSILLADEPTGSLDSENGLRVLELLRTLNQEERITVLLATHSPEAAAYARRTLRMKDGVLESSASNHDSLSASV